MKLLRDILKEVFRQTSEADVVPFPSNRSGTSRATSGAGQVIPMGQGAARVNQAILNNPNLDSKEIHTLIKTIENLQEKGQDGQMAIYDDEVDSFMGQLEDRYLAKNRKLSLKALGSRGVDILDSYFMDVLRAKRSISPEQYRAAQNLEMKYLKFSAGFDDEQVEAERTLR